MIKLNMNYGKLKSSYLFFNISKKVKEYKEKNPDKYIYRMGIGDVTLPLTSTVIDAFHKAVDDQAKKETFHGYLYEGGLECVRESIREYYSQRNVNLNINEVFISSGASDELGDILDLFDKESNALVIEPAYPAYVDANVMAGRKIISLPSGIENNFLPLPDDDIDADLIYICSPNNPTGAVYDRIGLKKWVDFANKMGAIIIFDAAYEAYIEDDNLPRSIFEIDGAKTCAIEICSLSKTAGFTGTRLGYTIIPLSLERNGMNINEMWVRNRTTKTNGVSYILQIGANAVFSKKGFEEIKRNIEYYKRNAKLLTDTFERLEIYYTGGKNSPYIWFKCPNNMSSWELFDYLLNEVQIVGTPGEGFGKCGEGFFRFSTFGSYEDTKEAAKRLEKIFG